MAGADHAATPEYIGAPGAGRTTRNVAPGGGTLFSRVDRSAMELHQMADDRQGRDPDLRTLASCRSFPAGNARTRAEGSRPRRRRRYRCTDISTESPTRRHATSMRPPFGVNLTAFDNRFQSTCCRRPGSPESADAVRIDDPCALDALGVGRWPDGLDRRRNDFGQRRAAARPDAACRRRFATRRAGHRRAAAAPAHCVRSPRSPAGVARRGSGRSRACAPSRRWRSAASAARARSSSGIRP